MASFLTWLVWGNRQQQPAAQEPSSAVATKTIQATEQLEEREEQLKKKRGQLEKRIEAEQENARKFLAQGDKKRALECLKKKKMLTTQMESIDNMIMRVIEQRVTLESQVTTLSVVSALHQAALTAKENMQTANIEKVEQVMEDLNNTNDDMRQLHEALAAPTGMAAALDEDELLNELDELDALDQAEELVPAPARPSKAEQARRAAVAKTARVAQPPAAAAAAAEEEERALEEELRAEAAS